MAWPVSRADGYLVAAAAWNELVSALAAWGGDVNAGNHSLVNLNTLRVSVIAPQAGNTLAISGGVTAARTETDPNGLYANFLTVNLAGTAAGFALGQALWVNTPATFSTSSFVNGMEIALRHGGSGGSGTGHIANSSVLSLSAQAVGGAVIDACSVLFIGTNAAASGWSVYDASGTRAYFSSKVGIGAVNPTVSGSGKLHHSGDTCRILDSANAPANSAAAGNIGEIRISAPYIYFHDGTDWRRVAGATF